MAKPDRKPDPDFEPDYDTADVEYDEAPQTDYDEGAQPDYEADFTDPDSIEASQEYYKRSQK